MANNISPLVSIIVVTYNSAKTVLETLESMKEQSYKNLELIVSDDCSTDDTVAICEKWLIENGARFVRTELVTTAKNTGIAPNFNRGIAVAKGEWIKTIAGDDALFPYIIEEYVKYINCNPNAKFLHSNIASYKDTFEEKNRCYTNKTANYRLNQANITPEEQYQVLLRKCLIRAPTVMIKKEVFDLVGRFDETYPLWEDRPMWLKITQHNIKLIYIDILGAKYRISSTSVQKKKNIEKLIPEYVVQRSRGYFKEILPKLPLFEKVVKGLLLYRILFIEEKGLNKNTRVMRMFMSITDFPLKTISGKIDKRFS